MSVQPEQTLFLRDEKSSLHGWIYGEVCGGCAGSSISQSHNTAQHNAAPLPQTHHRELSVHPEQTLFFRDEKSSLHGWIHGEVCGGCGGSSIRQYHSAAHKLTKRNVGSSRANPIFHG